MNVYINEDENECWGQPSSIYMLEVRNWSCCSPLLQRSENALSTWLARPWGSDNVGVRQRMALHRTLYSSKEIPPLHYLYKIVISLIYISSVYCALSVVY